MWGYDRIAEHHAMLADAVRTDAFRRAIRATVRPGDVVCDLGCGTGILSLFACEAGATRVYAIERSRAAGIAREVVAANGVADRVTVLHGDARGIRLPERVDVLVSEWMGHAGIEENMLPAVIDVRRRFLKPGGRLIPESVTVLAAPVEHAPSFAYVGYFATPVYGFDLAAVAEQGAAQPAIVQIDAPHLLAAPAVLAVLAVANATSAAIRSRSRFTVQRDAALHGVALWFESVLAGDVRLSTAPGAPRTHWHQLFLPVGPRPLEVRCGDVLELEIASHPAGWTMCWSWRGHVRAADGTERDRFARRERGPAGVTHVRRARGARRTHVAESSAAGPASASVSGAGRTGAASSRTDSRSRGRGRARR